MPSLVLTPTAVVNDPSYGTVPWTNPDGFRVPKFGEATAVIPAGGVTNYARASFDCSTLPAGVALTGVKATWALRATVSDYRLPRDASVRLAPAGLGPVGDDKARPGTTNWSTVYHAWEYGGDGDLWGAGFDADTVRANGIDALFAGRSPDAGRGTGDAATLTLFYS